MGIGDGGEGAGRGRIVGRGEPVDEEVGELFGGVGAGGVAGQAPVIAVSIGLFRGG